MSAVRDSDDAAWEAFFVAQAGEYRALADAYRRKAEAHLLHPIGSKDQRKQLADASMTIADR